VLWRIYHRSFVQRPDQGCPIKAESLTVNTNIFDSLRGPFLLDCQLVGRCEQQQQQQQHRKNLQQGFETGFVI
jgi:hypothetical protein